MYRSKNPDPLAWPFTNICVYARPKGEGYIQVYWHKHHHMLSDGDTLITRNVVIYICSLAERSHAMERKATRWLRNRGYSNVFTLPDMFK